MAQQKVFIVGIGDDGLEGLNPTARGVVTAAQLLIGGPQTLARIPGEAERFPFEGDFDAVVECIERNSGKRIVILAVGDPLFFGTARYLCGRLGKDRFEVVPHVSSMQLAFARVKESWDEAYLANLATQPLDRVLEKIRTAQVAGLFTTEQHTPQVVARALLERRIDYFQAYVCENLGSPDERVFQGELADVAEQPFGPLNVMILVRRPDVPDRPAERVGRRLFGNPDEAFLQSQPHRGLLTPAEVRAVALAQMDLGPTSVVWDVGAGSGSVAIEAAQIAAGGSVYAIERDPDDYQLIAENAERFGVPNLIPVLGQAPEAWEGLPDPDAVFVGGTGRAVAGIATLAFARLRPGGRIVVNVGSLENLAEVRQVLIEISGDAAVWMLNVARGNDQFERLRFESLNPTFLVRSIRTEG